VNTGRPDRLAATVNPDHPDRPDAMVNRAPRAF